MPTVVGVLVVDVAVCVTATEKVFLNSGWMHNPQDVECLRSKPGVVTSVFRKQVFLVCWHAVGCLGQHTVTARECGCGCLVGLHVNDHARCVWLLWCGCVV